MFVADVDEDVGITIAKLPGVQALQASAAADIMVKAQALASESTDTGNYQASFGVDTEPGPDGVTDYVVYNDDPAAVIIEYGHMTRPTKNSPGTFVPGKHYLRRAID